MAQDKTTTRIDIEVNEEQAQAILKDLEVDIQKGQDDAAEELARVGRRDLRRTLFEQEHVATGTGYLSINERQTGDREWSVFAADYLKDVETGTRPHYPEKSIRLIQWANMHGWPVQAIQEHIAEFGTDAHAWIGPGLSRLRKTAAERGASVIERRSERIQ